MVLLGPGSSPGVTRIGGIASVAYPFDKLRVTAILAMKRRGLDALDDAVDEDGHRARNRPRIDCAYRAK
jgi:hypothetical protein